MMVTCVSEADLFRAIKATPEWRRFSRGYLRDKIRREARAWEMTLTYRGRYSREVLEGIFNRVEEGAIWFGQLLRGRNRQLILSTSNTRLNDWLEDLLFGPDDAASRFARACRNKISGADSGVPSLFLYLQNPKDAKILLPTSQRGLEKVRGLPIGNKHESSYYRDFCDRVNELQREYEFWPEEMDWVLWGLKKYVERVNSHFQFDEGPLA